MYSDFWYDDPEIKTLLGQLQELQQNQQDQAGSSVSEVALFTSAAASVNRSLEKVFGKLYVDAFRQWIMPGTSVPFDDYLLEDFAKVENDYKVYIFLNAHYIPAQLREQIRAKLATSNATALWFFAPGYNDEAGCSLANMKDLTGISFAKKDDYYGHFQVTTTNGFQYGTQVNPEEFQKGLLWKKWPNNLEEYQFSPAIYAKDTNAEVLGTLDGLQQAGLVKKQTQGLTTYWSAAPLVPTPMLRQLFKEAGVNVYSNKKDVVFANSRFMAIMANDTEGERTLSLPQASRVTNALTKEVIGSGDAISITTKQNETVLLALEPLT